MRRVISHFKENWIKYGFETSVVIIGVILAFSVNNWKDNLLDRSKEQTLLFGLKDEFERNEAQLDVNLRRINRAIESSNILINLTGPNPGVVAIDSLSSLISSVRIVSTYRPGQGVLQDLVNSGNLVLITNSELRKLLSNWPSLVLDGKDDEERIFEARERYLIPYLEDKFNYYDSQRHDTSRFNITNVDFLKDMVFQNRVSRLHHTYRLIVNEYSHIQEANERILELIEQELK